MLSTCKFKMIDTDIDKLSHERQVRELHMVKKEEGVEKRQPNGPETATSRSLADPLAAAPWSLPASIDPFPHWHYHGTQTNSINKLSHCKCVGSQIVASVHPLHAMQQASCMPSVLV